MEQASDKWLLLGANVVIEHLLNVDNPFWSGFRDEMRALNFRLWITPEIEFEVFRGMLSKGDQTVLRNFLGKFKIDTFEETQTVPDLWSRATKIGQLYSLSACKGIDAIDCTIAAYAQYYSDKLRLATFNNKHFPSKLFDLESMMNFVIKDEIKVLGIYRFSDDKFKKLELKYNKSQAKKLSK